MKDSLAKVLRESGFIKSASTWHKVGPDTVLVVNLQKSQYGSQYYINLGVWLNALGVTQKPPENQCHIQLRADSIPGENARMLGKALNLEDASLSPEEREAFIVDFMRREAISFLESIATLSGIRAAIEGQWLRNAFVHWQVKELIPAEKQP